MLKYLSRDFLNDSTKLASRAQEKFCSFKTISKSQEVLSPAVGGPIKRMVAGAVSDIPTHTLPAAPRLYLDSQADSSEFVMVPGSSVLMSHTELMAMSASKSSGSLQLLPLVSPARSPHPDNDRPVSRTSVPTLTEEVEEEEWERREEARGRAGQEQATRTCRIKEEKNHLNYETKQSMSRGGEGVKGRLETAEVAVQVSRVQAGLEQVLQLVLQVDLHKNTPASPPVPIPPAPPAVPLNPPSLPLTIPVEGNIRPSPGTRLRRGFSHDDTMGDDQKRCHTQQTANFKKQTNFKYSYFRYSWREELEKFRSTRRPLGGVSSLIDAFSSGAAGLAGSPSRKASAADAFPDMEAVKARRRGSLQIQLDSSSMAQVGP